MNLIISLFFLFLLSGCATLDDFVEDVKEELKQDIKDKVNEVLE